jgi:hypothetical protein
VIGYYTLFWLVLVMVAILNGAVREFTYGRILSELHAHQLSTLTAILLCGVAVWIFARSFPVASIDSAFAIGLIWLLLTVAFEFCFGRFVARLSWTKLLADYNLLAGRVWPVFLVWIFILPSLVYWLGSSLS